MKVSSEEYLDLNVVNIYNKAEKFLQYNKSIEQQLINHAKAGFPYEIVGFLLGISGDDETVTTLLPVDNAAKEQERRFKINELDYIKAETHALANGLEVIGIYHSHPDYPAIPSKYDLEYAQDVFAYLIISIESTGLAQINSWKKESGKFIQQPVKLK